MQFYRISGLSVAADVVLPGLIAADEGKPDVTISRGRVPSHLDGPSSSGPTWEVAGDTFLLRVPGIARFLLKAGREIVFEPESESALVDVPIFLMGTVFGLLLHLREQVVLHASAVRVNGKAILFCGASGSGKSTLAAALGQRGYSVLVDDVCSISIVKDGVAVHPDGRQLKLWAHAIERLDLMPARGERIRGKVDKYYVSPAQVFTEPLPLGAVYVLREARPPHASGIQKPNVVDAALLLRRNAYRPLMVRRLNQRENYFDAAVRIANVAGIFYLTRNLDFAQVPDVMGWLERHWRELRLLEPAA